MYTYFIYKLWIVTGGGGGKEKKEGGGRGVYILLRPE